MKSLLVLNIYISSAIFCSSCTPLHYSILFDTLKKKKDLKVLVKTKDHCHEESQPLPNVCWHQMLGKQCRHKKSRAHLDLRFLLIRFYLLYRQKHSDRQSKWDLLDACSLPHHLVLGQNEGKSLEFQASISSGQQGPEDLSHHPRTGFLD